MNDKHIATLMTRNDIIELIDKDIKEAFVLLKESSKKYKYGDVDLTNAIIVTKKFY